MSRPAVTLTEAVVLKGLDAILSRERGLAARLAEELELGESRVSQFRSGHPCPAQHVRPIAEFLKVPEMFLIKGVVIRGDGKMEQVDDEIIFAQSPQMAEFKRQEIINDFGADALPEMPENVSTPERIRILTARWAELFTAKIRVEDAKRIAQLESENAALKNEAKVDLEKPPAGERDSVSEKVRKVK